jgi:hypothetical protein
VLVAYLTPALHRVSLGFVGSQTTSHWEDLRLTLPTLLCLLSVRRRSDHCRWIVRGGCRRYRLDPHLNTTSVARGRLVSWRPFLLICEEGHRPVSCKIKHLARRPCVPVRTLVRTPDRPLGPENKGFALPGVRTAYRVPNGPLGAYLRPPATCFGGLSACSAAANFFSLRFFLAVAM